MRQRIRYARPRSTARLAGSVLALAAIIACGSKGTRPDHPAPQGRGSASGPAVGSAGGGSGSAAEGTVPDIGCLTTTCVFYAATATYYTCLASGNGTCFHIGTTCAPADACMFDPAAVAYKQCTRAVEGRCAAWGGACAPATRCLFDPKDGLHRTCAQVTGGTCARYGALCSP